MRRVKTSRVADDVQIMIFLRAVGVNIADSDWKRTREFVSAAVEHTKAVENERICRMIYKFARLEQHVNYRGLLRAIVPIIRGWRRYAPQ